MKTEVKIVLYPELHKSKNGSFFEGLTRPIFENEGYRLEMNVNFTGLEVDLYGKHKNRNEKLLVECKAKEKVNSDAIKMFYYNLLIEKKADYGYFFYTHELMHQAAGLKVKHEEKDSKVSTFFGPEKIISAFVEIGKIKKFEKTLLSTTKNFEKLILAYTYFGNYYIAITYEGTEDKSFHVFDASTLNSINEKGISGKEGVKIIETLEKSIKELGNYNHSEIYNETASLFNANNKIYIDFSKEFSTFLNSTDSIFAHSKVDNIFLEDLFVVPDLRPINYENINNKKLVQFSSLDDIFIQGEQGFRIALFGDYVSGKTACCKYIIAEFFNKNLYPVLIKGSEIRNNIRRETLLKIANDAYDKQYETNLSFDKIENEKIVIVIDDLHLSTNRKSKFWSRLIENLEDEFENIVITSHDSALLKVGLKTKEKKTLFENFEIFKILELGPKLRYELIDKWYKLGDDNNYLIDKNEILARLDQAQKHIKTIIGKNFVPSYPFYILSALQALESGNIENSNFSIYGFYYELLIKNSIGKTIKDNREYNLYINYLSHYSYYLFEMEEKEINIREFSIFHSSFCDKIDYNFSQNEALRTLEKSKLFSIDNGSIRFKERYIYYYFVANFLSKRLSKSKKDSEESDRDKAKYVVKNLIQRVYRNEYASIVMFLTHLSKDGFIISTLIENAKSIFSENIPCHLEHDIKGINELVEKLPEQVIELIDVEEKRQDELEEKEEAERIEKELEENIEVSNQPKLDEDINTIDYFAKVTLALKTLDLLGQLAKAYWGELDAKEKDEVVFETYNLGLRTLNSYLQIIEDNSNEIVEHLSQVIEEKHIKDRYELKKVVKESVRNFIFRLSFLASWGLIKRISNSVGTDKLKKTYSNVLNTYPYTSYKLTNLSIELDHNTKIPFGDVKKYLSESSGNNIAKIMLQNLVINHLYMFDTKIREKQKICSLLGIKIQDQRLIDKTSKIKKN